MIKLIDFNSQFARGMQSAGNFKVRSNFDRIIFCGMGGSAIPGELISMLWIDKLNCYLNRGSGLPYWAGRESLVICTSWSGDTEETLSSFDEAINRKLNVVAVSSGGQLVDKARNANVLFITLPSENIPARFGIGYMAASILTLLHNSDIIDYSLPAGISNEPSAGADFSSRIGNKIPLIYSSYQWRFLARFWKIHFNENSKIHSFSNYFPESAHNEIAGFAQAGRNNFFPIILLDPGEEKADILKLQKFAAFLRNQGVDSQLVEIGGENRLEKIIRNYNHAILVSTSLARTQGMEPFDTAIIENFKKM